MCGVWGGIRLKAWSEERLARPAPQSLNEFPSLKRRRQGERSAPGRSPRYRMTLPPWVPPPLAGEGARGRDPLRDDFHRAAIVGVERELLGDVEQPQPFELASALERANIQRTQAARCQDRAQVRLGVEIVAGEEDIEPYASYLPLLQRPGERRVERLDHLRARYHSRDLFGGGEALRRRQIVEGLVEGIADLDDRLAAELLLKLRDP